MDPLATDIVVTADPARPGVAHAGWLRFGAMQVACSLGRSGIALTKHEGDGATPAGRFPLRRVLFRPDRASRPFTALPVHPMVPADGWCDDPQHRDYNRPVQLPFPAGREKLWRRDGLYDVLVVLGYNDDPVVPGAGSAIFLHVAPADGGPTAGCVAVAFRDLLAILEGCSTATHIAIQASAGR